MKICFVGRPGKAGSVLVTALVLGVILGISLGGYLLWVRSQHALVVESQAWNSALALAEAGVEDGMAQINIAYGNFMFATNYPPSIQTNWGPLTAEGVYGPRLNTLQDGSYSVIVLPTNPGPTITATGYTQVPFMGVPIKRVVQVRTTTAPVFANAMSALSGITTKGNKLTVDSYDSADPNHSLNGMYNPATRLAGGDVASLTGTIIIQNANIYGHVRTGPTGNYTIGNGTVGDLNWTGPQVEPGWYANDFTLDVSDVVAPFTNAFQVPPPTSNPTNTYPLTTGNYIVKGDFTIGLNQAMTVSGNVTLYVTGNFTMTDMNASTIQIGEGATLKLYVGTADITKPVSTRLRQVNVTIPANAMTFQYFGLPSNTSIVWNGNATYVGTVFAPEATFSCGGGGTKTTYDYQGSCVVNTVWMNGHFNFHFDQNLSRIGPMAGFAVTSWREL